jgi:hypothetical protein
MSIVEPRTSVVTIYQGDYLDRIRHLEAKHEAALESEKSATRLLSNEIVSTEIATEHEALVEEAEGSALHVRVKALGRKQWRELVSEHPPRKDDRSDVALGFNVESFKDVLVPVSIVSPALTDDDLDALSDADFDRLALAAIALNRSSDDSPKVLGRVSLTSQQSDET